jgi:hypothetical protein
VSLFVITLILISVFLTILLISSVDTHSIHVYNHVQELACQVFHDAITEFNTDAVRRTMRELPNVTRLVPSDDDTGNVALHIGELPLIGV